MKKILLLMAIFFSVLLQAQLNTLSMNLPQGHPRYLTDLPCIGNRMPRMYM